MNNQSVSQACVGMMTNPNAVFYSSILMNLNLKEDLTMPTAAVDGVNMFINTKWFESLTPRARIGLLFHEVNHIVLDHINRSKLITGVCHSTYNKAADHVINLDALKLGFELPPNGLHDSRFEDMTTEEVYRILIDEGESEKGKPNPYGEDILPSEASSEDVQELIIRAASVAQATSDKAYGAIPEHIKRSIEKMVNPVLPWNVLLDDFVSNSVDQEDYSMRKPNRRYLPDFYLPTLYSESIDTAHVYFDVSGSVQQKDLDAFISETDYMRESKNLNNIVVCGFDTKIDSEQTIDANDPITDIALLGGGGTYIQPVIDKIIKDDPLFAIIFTDGFFSAYEPEELNVPIIWVIYDNPNWTSNIGTVVHYEAPRV